MCLEIYDVGTLSRADSFIIVVASRNPTSTTTTHGRVQAVQDRDCSRQGQLHLHPIWWPSHCATIAAPYPIPLMACLLRLGHCGMLRKPPDDAIPIQLTLHPPCRLELHVSPLPPALRRWPVISSDLAEASPTTSTTATPRGNKPLWLLTSPREPTFPTSLLPLLSPSRAVR